ncbi:PadR family transcriptional regulator [Allonocardiopsis opalescens]|uniref:DNA-binding PadR family transcriptional regulator n=1 Tax=Allonocardiopsis opalescens TaxID=1144618 RepID=A0A2T0Q6U8_9ACTN|nr:PadR family transcriptional regulator [Allonocardiopsis opalescens]PRX99548.1 DNA-binding PadR family transcriptional regulator [Allonocardiopsis opalescens]
MAARRPDRAKALELAVLGLLADAPLHGYELRKRLNTTLGALRAFSYGSLYPCLKDLLRRGLIAEDTRVPAADPGRGAPARPLAGRRAKIVYRLTPEGREHLRRRLAEAGPAAWEDDGFGVHFTLFAQTRADIRLRILEGRRNRLEERVESCRTALARTRERQDGYAAELQRHGLESVEREVRWLNELIGRERAAAGERGAQQRRHAPSSGTDRGDAD